MNNYSIKNLLNPARDLEHINIEEFVTAQREGLRGNSDSLRKATRIMWEDVIFKAPYHFLRGATTGACVGYLINPSLATVVLSSFFGATLDNSQFCGRFLYHGRRGFFSYELQE